MSDSKKILYKRDTADEALLSLLQQLALIKGMYFIDKVEEIIIFGSYAKNAERVHDLDVYVQVDECRDMAKIKKYYETFNKPTNDVMLQMCFHTERLMKFLKNGKRVISLYSNVRDAVSEAHRDIATSEAHFVIYKNGKIRSDEVMELLKMNPSFVETTDDD